MIPAFAFTAIIAAGLVPIPAGEQMVRDAASGFEVVVRTGAFHMERTEVTQREYQEVMGANPSRYKGGERPVEMVTWRDAITYANRRSEREKLVPCYDPRTAERRLGCTGYRLPTSAEWTIAFAGASGEFRGTGYQDTAQLTAAEAAGTREAAGGKPNRYGLFGMAGNVWEWCEDWYAQEPQLDATRDPMGPVTGIAKVIRGGSFLTGGTEWNRGLRNSMEPDKRSQFTGFRLVRGGSPAAAAARPDAEWLGRFQHPATQPLPALTPNAKQVWTGVLGVPKQAAAVPRFSVGRTVRTPIWDGELGDLAIEPGFPARLLILSPARKPRGRMPVILVPYYDVDTPAGIEMGGRRFTPGGTRAFAALAVQRGFMAVGIRWFGESDGEGYDEAVWQMAKRHPGVTPLGKWVFDLGRIVDYLRTRADVDPERIGMIGHSLGGKLALYGAAFEPRIRATVSSEPGMSLAFSNFRDFWYLGEAARKLPAGADHHDLLALMRPRPFLLIAGESADGDKSWPFLAAAQATYPAAERANLGMINHRSGHSPTEQSVLLAMEWLERFLTR